MARNPKPFLYGPLKLRDGLVFPVSRVIEQFATIEDRKLLRRISGELQRACQFYVSNRETHVAPQRVRAQLKAILHPASLLHAKLRDLPATTYAQLEDAMMAPSGGAAKLVALVGRLNAGLPEWIEQSSGAGKDPDDPVGNQLVQDALAVFMRITGRTTPPTMKFHSASTSSDPDDVSSSRFGQFVVAVEAAIVAEMEKVKDARRGGYRIQNKRASIREALKRARVARSL